MKMEYFLYGVSEAHRCILDLRELEARLNAMQDDFDLKKQQYISEERSNPRAAAMQSSFA